MGAGKTTLMFEAARLLAAQGKRVGLVTNDQAPELVDTAILTQTGSAVTEVSGSCFCCNFPGLVRAVNRLTTEAGAELILAEPVGSCTDLSATILQPLKDNQGGNVTLAPLSVLADPQRLRAILEGTSAGLHDSSAYIFRKQLEEADIILLTKADTLCEEERSLLCSRLATAYPLAETFIVSAKNGHGLDAWLHAVLTRFDSGSQLVEVDYDMYAEGEAVLGWLNATFEVKSASCLVWNAFAKKLMNGLSARFDSIHAAVGHVKLAIDTGQSLVTANLVGTRETLEIHGAMTQGTEAKLTLNARVQMAPEALEKIVRDQIQLLRESGLQAIPVAWRCLSPGRPTPTYRYSAKIHSVKTVGL